MNEPTTNERRLWSYGVALTILLALEIVLILVLDPDLARAVAGGILAEVFSGREGGIPVAIASGVPPLLVWQISITQDMAAFLLVYPFFLWAIHRYHDRDNLLMRQLRRIEQAARRHKRYVHRYGPLGVFLFMLIPFLVNGPLVGGVAGRLAGIPTRRLLLPVVAASMVAAAAWTFFFDQTIGRLVDVDARLGYAIAGAIAAGLVIAAAVGVVRDERRHAEELRDDGAGAAGEEE